MVQKISSESGVAARPLTANIRQPLSAKPDHSPTRGPYNRRPRPNVSSVVPTANVAYQNRAANSVTPNIPYDASMNQYSRIGLSVRS